MKNRFTVGALAILAITAGWIPEAAATWPAGVWTHVSKVVYDNPANPTTVEIHGAFMVHNGDTTTPYSGYSAPAEGYMYFTCPAGKQATCKMEWADLEKNIGTASDQCLGFGGDMLPTGTLRKGCNPASNPDTYPINIGVMGAFSPCMVMKAFVAANPTDGCGSGSSSSSTSGSASTSGSSTAASSTGSSSSHSTSAGAGGGSSSGGKGSGCSLAAAPGEGTSPWLLAIPALGAGLALRRKAGRRRPR